MKINTDDPSTPAKSNKEFWHQHINQWQQSGLSQQAYCEKQQISYTSFGYWRGQFRRDAGQVKKKKFVPVEMRQSQQDSALSIKVKLFSGLVISIPCNMGASHIAELIRMLEMPHA